MPETLATNAVTGTEIAAAIRSATEEVFSTMLAMEIAARDTVSGQTSACSQSGVVALLGLAGEWAGSGSLSCHPGLACKMAGQLLMAEYDTVNEDVLDAVAEVANMIVGNVKTILEEKLGPMGLSTPTVIYGRNFETRSVGNKDWVIVPFDCGGESMQVQVSIAPNRNNRGARPPAGFPLTANVSL
jgi:chemotaxis protein CheX